MVSIGTTQRSTKASRYSVFQRVRGAGGQTSRRSREKEAPVGRTRRLNWCRGSRTKEKTETTERTLRAIGESGGAERGFSFVLNPFIVRTTGATNFIGCREGGPQARGDTVSR